VAHRISEPLLAVRNRLAGRRFGQSVPDHPLIKVLGMTGGDGVDATIRAEVL